MVLSFYVHWYVAAPAPSPNRRMKWCQNILLRMLSMTAAGAWIIIDWTTLGANCDGLNPIWARNWLRNTLLMLTTVLCGAASLRRSAIRLHFGERLTTNLAILFMVTSAAYGIWIGYLMSSHNPDSWGLEGALLLQVSAFFTVLKAQKLFQGKQS